MDRRPKELDELGAAAHGDKRFVPCHQDEAAAFKQCEVLPDGSDRVQVLRDVLADLKKLLG